MSGFPAEPELPDGFFGINARLLEPRPAIGQIDKLARQLDSLTTPVDFGKG